jgi:predicted MFS family arabinose efflux permease
MHASSNQRLWNRDFTLLFASSLLVWCSFFFLMPTLPVYIVEHLHGAPAQIGLISSALTVSAIVGRPLAGYALDRWGRRSIQLGFLVLFCVAMFSYHLASSLWILVAIRLFHGLPFGGATTAASTVAADLTPEHRRGEGLGYFGLSTNLAMAVGPGIGLALMGLGSFSNLFTAAGLVALAAVLLGWLVRYPTIRNPSAKFSLASLIERRVGWLSIGTALTYAGYGGIVTFITLYAADRGIAHPAWFFTAYALGLVLSRPLSGRLFDRRGPNWIVAVGLALLCSSYCTLGWWPTETGYLVAAGLLGLGFGTIGPTLFAMAVNLVPADRRGAANATVGTAIDVGIGGGSNIFGAVAQATGSYPAMFLAAGASMLLPALLFAFLVLPRYARSVSAGPAE